MKKVLALLGALLLLGTFSTAALAEGNTAEYHLEELGMSISVPEEMIVITRDFVSDEQALLDAGINLSDIESSFIASNIYLNALSDDFLYEIVVTMVDYQGSKDIWSFNELDEDTLVELAPTLAKFIETTLGITASFERIYKGEQATFTVFSLEQTQNERQSYGEQYYTIINGIAINVTLQSYNGPVSQEQSAFQQTIVDSIVFDEILPKPAATSSNSPASSSSNTRSTKENSQDEKTNSSGSGINWRKALLQGLIAGLIVGIIGMVARAVAVKSTTKRELAPCMVNPHTFTGEVFVYQGKAYDKVKYINNRIIRLNATHKSINTLHKLLTDAEKKAASGKPAAVLGEMEAEALRTIILYRQ